MTEDLMCVSQKANRSIVRLHYRIKMKESLKPKIFNDAIEKDMTVK